MILPRKNILKLKQYIPPLSKRKGMLRLDFNENTLGASPKVLEKIKNSSKEDIGVYPEYNIFYDKLSKYLKTKKSEIIITNGSDEAIKIIIDTYIENGDEIILPIPTFPMFSIYAGIVSAMLKTVPYNKTDLSFPVKDVLNTINNNTRIVIIVNPNNPTGTLIEKEDIIRITKKAKNSLVLIDEAYSQFSKVSCIDLINKYKNLVIIQTFSKVFGLAGLRIGYIVSCEYNINNIMKVCSPYNVNSIAVLAGCRALEDIEYIEWYVNEVENAKKLLYEELKVLNIKTFPSSANFILAYFGDKCNYIQKKLSKKGILVRDRSMDTLLNGCIRITVGTLEQTRKFITELKRILG